MIRTFGNFDWKMSCVLLSVPLICSLIFFCMYYVATHKPSTVLNARIAEEEEDIAQNLSSLGEEGISQKPSTVRAAEEDESSVSPDLQPQDQLYERPPDQMYQQSHDLPSDQKGVSQRRKLPAPIPDMADFSLWSLLRKNIGKDLHNVSKNPLRNEVYPHSEINSFFCLIKKYTLTKWLLFYCIHNCMCIFHKAFFFPSPLPAP